jgi:hypothetical protein
MSPINISLLLVLALLVAAVLVVAMNYKQVNSSIERFITGTVNNNGVVDGAVGGVVDGAVGGAVGGVVDGAVGGAVGGAVTEDQFANPSEPSDVPFAAGNAPSNCYPKNQLNPLELLPSDPNSKWAQVNPQGAGDIAGKNYLNAGALIGVNTVGQSLRNASWDLRSEPANPQVTVSPWFNSTIEPDINRRTMEIA